MASITTNGMMSATAYEGELACGIQTVPPAGGAFDGGKMYATWSGSQPRGHVVVTNLTTNYSQHTTLSKANHGVEIYDGVLDAGSSNSDSFSIEFGGKAETLYCAGQKFDGNGSAEISGIALRIFQTGNCA